ncbi:MAG: membrane-bound lytic murein transglycosylase MltF, partial [Vibrio sp.]
SQNGDPDSWLDVKDRLPQLQQKKYFTQTRYGYARGEEARSYVENIRRYYQSIIGHLEQHRVAVGDESIEDLAVIEFDETLLNQDTSNDELDEEVVKLEAESIGNRNRDLSSADEKQK